MSKNNSINKVLLTGGYGFLGTHVDNILAKNSYIINKFRSSDFDLTSEEQTYELINKFRPDAIIHMAARLGGIGDNNKNPSLYFEQNMKIGLNVLKISAEFKIKKLINIGTVCSYPRDLQTPFKENNLWNGFPEGTNSAYGIAKRALISYSEALNKQYNLNTVNLLLANLYGPGDDFREETSHVIPAIIRKIDNAKKCSINSINVWGDGTPTRDFLYIKDAAKGILKSLNSDINGIKEGPINLASGRELSIEDLVKKLCEFMQFKGSVNYDKSKPNGQPKRLLDITKAKRLLNFSPEFSFDDGLAESVKYFYENENAIKNLKKKYL